MQVALTTDDNPLESAGCCMGHTKMSKLKLLQTVRDRKRFNLFLR